MSTVSSPPTSGKTAYTVQQMGRDLAEMLQLRPNRRRNAPHGASGRDGFPVTDEAT